MGNLIETKLNLMQKMAVLSDSKYILVTAGAGSGKTRVLTERILNLVNCKYVSPNNILAITFTNKASNVMKERLAEKGLNAYSLWISTFHSSCVRILRENAHLIDGYNSNFSIFDEADKLKLISQILKENDKAEDDKFKKNLIYHLSNYKNKNQSLESYAINFSFENDIDDVIKFIKIYEEKMKENNAFDFDDLLLKAYRLLLTNPNVLNYYRNKFKHILVDEFQDTNEIQYDFIKLLAGMENSVFVVGDEDQCIYSWRGANYKNISNFSKDFKDVEVIKLEQNYRSTKNIIAGANKIISKNVQRIEKSLWTENSEGISIDYKKCYNEHEEAEFVANSIYSLKNFNGYNYKDIAVLLRLNSLTRNIEEKLLNYGINYKVYGGMKFYDRLEVKNFLAYLKVLNNIKDDISFNKIANWPRRNVGEASIDALKQLDKTKSLLENLINLNNFELKSSTKTKLEGLQNLFLDFLNQKENLTLDELVDYIVDKLNLKESLDKDEEDKNRMLNIEQLVLSIKEFCKNNPDASLSNYLQSVTLVSDMDNYDENEDCVTIATVHASKGLEFKCVFIIGLEDGIFPLIRQDDDSDEEEERRLMYVAITRGMERVYLTCCKNRFLYGYTRFQRPSVYLKDLGFESSYIYNYFDTNENTNKAKSANISIKSSNKTSKEDSLLKSIIAPICKEEVISKATEIKIKNTTEDKDFKVGDKVIHSKFGEGIILSINSDMAKINFKGVGVKELMINYAPLTKV